MFKSHRIVFLVEAYVRVCLQPKGRSRIHQGSLQEVRACIETVMRSILKGHWPERWIFMGHARIGIVSVNATLTLVTFILTPVYAINFVINQRVIL